MTILKTLVREGKIADKKGYCFEVYYKPEYPQIISALFKTRIGAQRKLNSYLKTGRIDFYGNAE